MNGYSDEENRGMWVDVISDDDGKIQTLTD